MLVDDKDDLRNSLVAEFAKSRGEEPVEKAPVDKTPVEKAPPAADKAPVDKTPVDKAPVDKAPVDKAAKPDKEPDKAPTLDDVKFIDPPAKWSKKDKEDWAKLQELAALDPKLGANIMSVQRILAGRNKAVEQDYTRKTMELALERGKYQQLEQVIAPQRQKWQAAGLDDARAIAQVLAYSEMADKNFPQFIEHVARERGFDLAQHVLSTRPHLRAASGAQPNVAQDGTAPSNHAAVSPAVAAELEALKREVVNLRQFAGQTHQWRQQTEQSRTAEVTVQASQEMQAFQNAADAQGQPLHPHFNDVREDMALLLRSGGAQTLPQAYEKAVRMNDSVWTRIQESEEVKRNAAAATQRAADERRRAEEAERARKAGSSIGGSSVDYTPSANGQPLSLREELAAQFQRARQDGARV